jgi:hypothetical protein
MPSSPRAMPPSGPTSRKSDASGRQLGRTISTPAARRGDRRPTSPAASQAACFVGHHRRVHSCRTPYDRRRFAWEPLFLSALIDFYCAWVYRRGRQPKIMEGFREIPDEEALKPNSPEERGNTPAALAPSDSLHPCPPPPREFRDIPFSKCP